MASNLPRQDLGEDDNLLIEAVTLLVQRQRETEARIAELEARMAPGHLRDEQRMAALREQLDQLRSEPVVQPIPPTSLEARRQPAPSTLSALSGPSEPSPPASSPTPPSPPSPPSPPRLEPVAPPSGAATPPRVDSVSVASGSSEAWNVFGVTPRQRFSLLLIGVGVLALLYSAFLLIRFG